VGLSSRSIAGESAAAVGRLRRAPFPRHHCTKKKLIANLESFGEALCFMAIFCWPMDSATETKNNPPNFGALFLLFGHDRQQKGG